MPSPCPGMDPYLEAYWGDVHTSLTTYARDQLRDRLPGDLRARVQEYVHLQTNQDEKQRWSPDVRIVEHESTLLDRSQPSVIEVAEPLIVPISIEWTESRSGKYLAASK